MAAGLTCALALALLVACKSEDGAGLKRAGAANEGASATPAPAAPDGVRRITVAETRRALEAGRAVVIDVRGKDSYALGHIKGSLALTDAALDARLQALPKDTLLVFYCA
jgi:hypothetical protein